MLSVSCPTLIDLSPWLTLFKQKFSRWSSSNMLGTLLPQGLCTGSSLSWQLIFWISVDVYFMSLLINCDHLSNHISLCPDKNCSPFTLKVATFFFFFLNNTYHLINHYIIYLFVTFAVFILSLDCKILEGKDPICFFTDESLLPGM